MDASPHVTFKILPPTAFSFGLPLFALAVLLQPAIPAHYSRPLRFALAYPAVHAAYYAPYTYRHEPVEFSIPANFRWGIFAPYAILLALYWAFMTENDRRVELAWVGFDGEKGEELQRTVEAEEKLDRADAGEAGKRRARLEATAQVVAPTPVRPDTAAKLAAVLPAATANASPAVVAQPGYLPTPSPTPPFEDINPPSVSSAAPPPADLDMVSASSTSTLGTAQRLHPLHILLSALHLLTSMRGIGYVFGPPMKHLPTPPRSEQQFATGAIVTFFSASAISTACVALQVLDRDGQLPDFLATVIPCLPPSAAVFFSALTSRICIGLSLWVQMKIGFSGLAVGYWLLHHLTNYALDTVPFFKHVTWRSKFDTREYPPLFNRPFSGMGDGGCSRFWSAKWHFLFRAVFTGTLYNPSSKLAKKLGIPKRAAALLGAVLVFAGSAWMHWQGKALSFFSQCEPSSETDAMTSRKSPRVGASRNRTDRRRPGIPLVALDPFLGRLLVALV